MSVITGFPYNYTVQDTPYVPTETKLPTPVVDTATFDPIVFSLFWNKAVKLAKRNGWAVEFVKGALYPYEVKDGKHLVFSAKSVTELSSWLTQYHWSLGNQSFIADGW